jgi:YegS/Rv2252/BmrU family lipid kinase
VQKRYAIIANPAAGNGRALRKLPALKRLTDAADAKFDYYFTEAPYHAAHIADRISKNYDAIVAFGGDGTANEVMNGIAGTPTPLGLIPEGTGNDFARSIGVSRRLDKSFETLLNFSCRVIDLGTIGHRVFLNGVGIGFDGYVNQRTKKLKKIKGAFSYFYTILSSLALWKAIPIELEVDGQLVKSTSAFLVAIGNGSTCGGGMKLNPDASVHDSIFDICHISDIPIWKVLLNLRRLKDGTVGVIKEVDMVRGKHIRVKSALPLPVHFDGEIYESTETELNISVVPQSAVVIGQWSK